MRYGRGEAPDERPIYVSHVRLRDNGNDYVNEGAEHGIQPQGAWPLCLQCACGQPSRTHSSCGEEYRADEPDHHQRAKIEVHDNSVGKPAAGSVGIGLCLWLQFPEHESLNSGRHYRGRTSHPSEVLGDSQERQRYPDQD